jgi:hypothetical protein
MHVISDECGCISSSYTACLLACCVLLHVFPSAFSTCPLVREHLSSGIVVCAFHLGLIVRVHKPLGLLVRVQA